MKGPLKVHKWGVTSRVLGCFCLDPTSLMATRNPVNSPVEGKVVEISLFAKFHTSQVVVNGISEPSTVVTL